MRRIYVAKQRKCARFVVAGSAALNNLSLETSLPTQFRKKTKAAIAARLREILRLDGVDQEMRGLQTLVSGTTIINQEFTAAQFAPACS